MNHLQNKLYIILFILFYFGNGFISNSNSKVILQYFESRYTSIERRMPDIFMSGYSALWLPPTNRADSGNHSVGYDVYDRFDLGKPFNETLYGTEAKFKGLIYSAHTADINIYVDLVFNHNGFRDHRTPGFEAAGGYPGFALSLDYDSLGDFHHYTATSVYEMRLAGLIDIAQWKNHQYIRQPTVAHIDNLPGAPISTTNARFYPDPSPLLGQKTTISGFNLSDPLRGVPVSENATGLLIRHLRWMNEVMRVDGFRLDAVKHIPRWFFDDYYDLALLNKGRADRAGNPTTPLSFVEVYDGNISNVGIYTNTARNRDALDFPLFFAMRDELNAAGFGNFKNFIYASVDSYDDGIANNGTLGIHFAQAHDEGLFPPNNDNLAYAYILSRPGMAKVYFNALEFGTGRPFPRTGRGDALGGQFGDTLINLIDIRNEYAHGALIERYLENKYNPHAARHYVFERENSLIVGLNLRENAGYDEVVVNTAFPPGSILSELTGTAASPTHNQSGALYTQVTVNSWGQIPMRIPRSNVGRGFVMYGLKNPQGTLSIGPINSVIPADASTVPNGIRRITAIPVITASTVVFTLQTDSTENNALWKLDDGYIDHTGTLIKSGSYWGLFDGFQEVTTAGIVTSMRSVGTTGGLGRYSIVLPTDSLSEGYHYFTFIAFRERPAGSPPTFNTFRQVFYIDRKGPQINLISPSTTGWHDIRTQDALVSIICPDLTANSVHIFPNMPPGQTVSSLAPLAAPANQAIFADRSSFIWTWRNIPVGLHTLDILAYEESGNAAVTRFVNIHASFGIKSADGMLYPAETTNQHIYINDTVADLHLWGDNNVIDNLYVNIPGDLSGILLSVTGRVNNNALVIYIATESGGMPVTPSATDFSGLRGWTGWYARNVIVDTTQTVEQGVNFYAATWNIAPGGDPGRLGTGAIAFRRVSSGTTDMAPGAGVIMSASGVSGGPAEWFIPFSVLFPGIGAPGVVPDNARVGFAAFVLGGGDWSGADAVLGTLGSPNLPHNWPQGPAGGGNGLANAARINNFQWLYLDPEGDGIPVPVELSEFTIE